MWEPALNPCGRGRLWQAGRARSAQSCGPPPCFLSSRSRPVHIALLSYSRVTPRSFWSPSFPLCPVQRSEAPCYKRGDRVVSAWGPGLWGGIRTPPLPGCGAWAGYPQDSLPRRAVARMWWRWSAQHRARGTPALEHRPSLEPGRMERAPPALETVKCHAHGKHHRLRAVSTFRVRE